MFQIHAAPPVLNVDALPGGMPAPPGVEVSQTVQELARELPDMLPRLGVLTPWAVREGDLRWAPVVLPSAVNVEVFALNDALIKAIFQQHFGLELPYLGVIFGRTPLGYELDQAFSTTAYEPTLIQAVYNQADQAPTPRIVTLVWLQARRASAGRVSSLEQATRLLGGQLVFAQQVPVGTSTSRRLPTLPFGEALRAEKLRRTVAQ